LTSRKSQWQLTLLISRENFLSSSFLNLINLNTKAFNSAKHNHDFLSLFDEKEKKAGRE